MHLMLMILCQSFMSIEGQGEKKKKEEEEEEKKDEGEKEEDGRKRGREAAA